MKKRITGLLGVAMMATMLSGCGSGGQSQETKAAETTAEVKEAESGSEAKTEVSAEATDLSFWLSLIHISEPTRH